MILSGNIFWMSSRIILDLASSRISWDSLSSDFIFWRNMDFAQLWQTCLKILGQLLLIGSSGSLHGICLTTLNIMFIQWYRFTSYPNYIEIIQNELIHKEASYTAFTGRYIAELKEIISHG